MPLGRAAYNFAYLEWIVVWTIVKLRTDEFESVPRRQPSRRISRALARAISNTSPPLDANLRLSLVRFEQRFRNAIHLRNRLIHAHPYMSSEGTGQLGGGELESAKLFA